MIGRNWRIPLGLLLSLNNTLGPNAAFTAATVLAIAASVALSTSLEMTSRGMAIEAERTASALAGSADLEIVGGELGVPEALIEELAGVSGVQVASPLINAIVRVEATGMSLHILGIDLTLAADSRELEVRAGRVHVNDPLRLLARPDSVLITSELARRAGVALGDPLRVQSHLGIHELRIEGLLEDQGLARAFNGQVAVMDVYSLQVMLAREGSVDRIDVVAQPLFDVSRLAVALEDRIDGRATVRRAGSRLSALDQTVAALRISVLLVATIGSLVSGLLSYAAMSTAVERRLGEFYVLRSTGISARSIASWIAMDAAIAASAGTIIGLVAGTLLAQRLIPILSKVSEFFTASAISRSDVRVSAATIALAIAVGVVCALCGAIGPTRLATRRYALGPAERTLDIALPEGRTLDQTFLSIALAATAVLSALVPWPSSALRTLLILGLGTAAVIRSVLPALRWMERHRAALSRLIPRTGHLIGTGLRSKPRSTALAVAAIASLVAFVHGAIIVSASFSHTLLAMVASRYPDALVVTSGPLFAAGEAGVMRPEIAEIVRTTPGVDRLVERFSSTILFRGEEVSISAFPAGVPATLGLSLGNTRSGQNLRDALISGQLAVSPAFSSRFGLGAGDTIELSTLQGRRSFRIAGELPGLAGPSGIVFVDLVVFDQLWERPGATVIHVWTSKDKDDVIDEIRLRSDARQTLFFTDASELRDQTRKFAARFDGLLYGIGTLTIVLGAIAIANLLAGMVTARRVEFALLRGAGASPAQLSSIVIGDAMLVSAAGLITGCALGALLSAPMLDLLSAEFGLRVERHYDPVRFTELALSVMLAIALSAVYPAWLARRSSEPELVPPF